MMTTSRPWWRSPSLSFVLLVLVTGICLRIWFHPTSIGGTQIEKFSDPQKNAVAVTLEMNKLVISLASLVFGAVGSLLFSKDQGARVWRGADVALVVFTVFLAALAIYFSYTTYDKLVEMLSNEFLDLNGAILAQPRAGQVYSLTLSVVCLGILVIRLITGQSPAEEANDDEE